VRLTSVRAMPSAVHFARHAHLQPPAGNFTHNMFGFIRGVPNPQRSTLSLTRELQVEQENATGSFTTSFQGLKACISA